MLSGKQLRRLPKVKRHRRGMNRQQLARWVQERYPSGVFTDGEIDSMRAIERAIRSDYPMDHRVRALVVSEMAKIVGKSDSEPARIQAARVLVAADGINVKRESLDQKDEHHAEGETVHHTGGIGIATVDLLSHPDYLEFLRQRALTEDNADCDTSPVCSNGKPRQVEDGPPSGSSRPGSNGRH